MLTIIQNRICHDLSINHRHLYRVHDLLCRRDKWHDWHCSFQLRRHTVRDIHRRQRLRPRLRRVLPDESEHVGSRFHSMGQEPPNRCQRQIDGPGNQILFQRLHRPLRRVQFEARHSRLRMLCCLILCQSHMGFQQVAWQLLLEEWARERNINWRWDGGLGAYGERIQELFEWRQWMRW
jgi:hypothetical protein